MKSSIVQIGSDKIEIENRGCSDPHSYRKKELYFETPSTENNTLSIVTINDDTILYLYWESFSSSAEDVNVLYVPETNVVFMGCGILSIRFCTKDKRLIDFDEVTLFWSFQRVQDYVLELGELECFLYSLDGKKIANTAVDPPYDMDILEHAIRFQSIVVGTTWLEYPKK